MAQHIPTIEERDNLPVTVGMCDLARGRCLGKRNRLAIAGWAALAPILGWLWVMYFTDHERMVRLDERQVAFERTMAEMKQDLREIKEILQKIQGDSKPTASVADGRKSTPSRFVVR